MHTSKSIRLSEEAYERLAAHKRDDETFSEVVLRLAGERSLVELAGVLDDEQADAVRDAIAERRERRRGDLEAVVDERGTGRRGCCASLLADLANASPGQKTALR